MTTTQNEVRCSVCRNPNVAEIDRLLRAGSSVRALAERFTDVSKSALARHSDHLVTQPEWPDVKEMAKDAEAIVARGGYEMLANSGPQTSAAQAVLTTQGQQVTVGAPDIALSSVFNCGFCRRVVAQAAGTVFIQRSGDTAPLPYALAAGAAVDGNIVLIGGSTAHPTASAIVLNLEV